MDRRTCFSDTVVVDEPMTDAAPQSNLNPSEQLLAQWQGVYLLALRITDNAHAAEDIVQEAYVKALPRLEQDRPDHPRTWLYSIAANLARNWLRDRSTHRRLEQTMAAGKNAYTQTPQLDDSALALRKHFKGLEEKYRTALSLHYEQGLSYREVAAVLQKPEGTTASLITRGIELLRQSLAGEGYTIAPAVVALHLTEWSATTVARPELLAAIKSALAAKSTAAGGAAAAKAGSTLLAGKAALAGGVLFAAAVTLTVVQLKTNPPATSPPAAAAPLVPVVPVTPIAGAAGDAGANPDARKPRFIDSSIAFNVYAWTHEERGKEIGMTPSWADSGIRVPDDDQWVLEPVISRQMEPDFPTYVKQVLAEIESIGASGVDLSSFGDPIPDDVAAQLAALPHLKILVIAQPFLTPRQMLLLGGMKSLESLTVYNAKPDDDFLAAIAALPHLKTLHLHGSMSDEGAAQLLKMPRLERFAGKISEAAFAKLARHPALAQLDLRDSYVLDETILNNPAVLPKNLNALSLGVSTSKLEKLPQLRALLPHVKVNGWNALADDPPGQKSQAEDEKDALIALDRTTHDAHIPLPAADPEIAAVLKDRKISAEWNETPLAQCVAEISAHCGVNIAFDPTLPNSNDLPAISLRITDMKCETALAWVLRLAAMDTVTIGRTVIVTAPEQRKLYHADTRVFTLEVSPNETPWTQDETNDLAAILNRWAEGGSAKLHEYGYAYDFQTISAPFARAFAPGKVEVDGRGAEGFAEFADDFAHHPQVPGVRRFEDALRVFDAPLNLPPSTNPATLRDAVTILRDATKLNLVIHPTLVVQDLDLLPPPATWHAKGGSAKDAVLALCNAAKLTLEFQNTGVVLTKSPVIMPAVYPVVLDLRPALKAGANDDELFTALNAIAKQGAGGIPFVVRGRWMAMTDAINASRAKALVDAAAKTGKIPAPQPLPWFFETANNFAQTSPTPGANAKARRSRKTDKNGTTGGSRSETSVESEGF